MNNSTGYHTLCLLNPRMSGEICMRQWNRTILVQIMPLRSLFAAKPLPNQCWVIAIWTSGNISKKKKRVGKTHLKMSSNSGVYLFPQCVDETYSLIVRNAHGCLFFFVHLFLLFHSIGICRDEMCRVMLGPVSHGTTWYDFFLHMVRSMYEQPTSKPNLDWSGRVVGG